jgi:dephospho-CoA kinase
MPRKRTEARASPRPRNATVAKARKPIIGLCGGIGAGKSTIARQLAALGCAVIDSDALAREALNRATVKRRLRRWLGRDVFLANGAVNRHALAQVVFANARSVARLNAMVHPAVAEMRSKRTRLAERDRAVRGIVWDSPLLIEAKLHRACDAVIFVQVPQKQRFARVAQARQWSRAELLRRENLQLPLDKKKEIADYVVDNTGEESTSLHQVRRVFSLILAKMAQEASQRRAQRSTAKATPRTRV